jgi:hypothetical protein
MVCVGFGSVYFVRDAGKKMNTIEPGANHVPWCNAVAN